MTPEEPQKDGPQKIPMPPKPSLFSTEGLVILTLAIFIDLVNVILGVLDFFLIGLILSPVWNFIALCTVGVWLWMKTGQQLKTTRGKQFARLGKRVALPFIAKCIPIAKFFPFWVWSVWSALDKGSSPQAESEEQEEQPAVEQPQVAPAPA